ncbi:hypothetical protein DUNSADRAFT_3927 [Dunaliella salina]|uniref:Encoded protein n=1 Tax=Dunaliella salina TaxID=3046 RepID=A0ABQ7FV26_DUNSA|nr:hypothetical protein DUNSADRAFT_3927 [Dunaliella salina]|eukprot:KAF5826248.1 hypothetical protein DUNSADRAFT_3927 [Dunaliella salina]
MGDFTARLTQQDFDDLKACADRGELYYLPSIEGYTDDQAHYQLIKSLCGYTHPLIEEKCAVAQRVPPKFSSFEAMKSFIQNNYKLQFCNICVEGRKVFLCEQQLYTRFDLDKHNKTGDDEGPLAESGFKGRWASKVERHLEYSGAMGFKVCVPIIVEMKRRLWYNGKMVFRVGRHPGHSGKVGFKVCVPMLAVMERRLKHSGKMGFRVERQVGRSGAMGFKVGVSMLVVMGRRMRHSGKISLGWKDTVGHKSTMGCKVGASMLVVVERRLRYSRKMVFEVEGHLGHNG